MVSIEPAGVEDLEALVPLFEAYRAFYECDPDEPGARRYLAERLGNGECTVFLAWDDDAAEGAREAVGFTLLYPTWESLGMGPQWVLYDLFVDPAGRGKGIGRLLLDRGVEHAREHGANSLLLETAIDNTPAQALYESAGWQRDDEFYTYLFEL